MPSIRSLGKEHGMGEGNFFTKRGGSIPMDHSVSFRNMNQGHTGRVHSTVLVVTKKFFQQVSKKLHWLLVSFSLHSSGRAVEQRRKLYPPPPHVVYTREDIRLCRVACIQRHGVAS